MNELGLDRNHFIIAATHTHSGPGGILDTRGDLKGMKEVTEFPNPEDHRYYSEKYCCSFKGSFGRSFCGQNLLYS